jgi:hypothetical protein
MKEMFPGLEFLRLMTLKAEFVAFRPESAAVRFVTVRAGDMILVHPALQE